MSPKDDIQLLRINYLRGPNIWTYRPALEVWLDLGELEDFPSNLIPGFTERLVAMLPALEEHHCGVGERGGFLQRLVEGTWAGHVLEHAVIELLNLAGMPTGFGQTRSTSQRGVYRMVFRARDEQVARTALAQGHRLLMAAINDQPFDVAAAVTAVRTEVDDNYLGPSTACIVAAATDRNIPHIRLNDGNLVQLGHGARQRRIWTAETEFTSAIAEGIAHDKDLTKTLLQACGVPVPEGVVVDSPADAWDAAQDIGLPVVVKPSDGNHGRGVALDLDNREDIEKAWAVADSEGSEVIVERYIKGDEHRLLVVGGKLVAAARGESLWVSGDGRSSVAELIDIQLNSDPRRGDAEEFPLETIRLEREPVIRLQLERQGLDAASVPAKGRRVLIQRNGNVAIDCTDDVHPEVAHAVALAARVVGLDIAGVDLVAEDISKPLGAQGGAIVEVNAGPGLLMHLKPAEGSPRPVGRAIVDHLFAEGETGRIPVVGVAGTQHTHTIARLVAWLMHLGGQRVGLACRDGLFLDTRRVETRNSAHWEPAHRLLINRNMGAAVIENGAASILRDGLAYDRCVVGIVTDLDGAEALAEFDITESDQLVKVLRTQVDVVLPEGVAVLNAMDERVAQMASLCDGSAILYGIDPLAPATVAHRATEGRAVIVAQNCIMLATGSAEVPLMPLDLLNAAWTRAALLEPILAAVAAAWAMGISPDLIVAGLKTFELDLPAPRPARVVAPVAPRTEHTGQEDRKTD
jgi:cyanophycin synthetase